jgi:hypothetical protein
MDGGGRSLTIGPGGGSLAAGTVGDQGMAEGGGLEPPRVAQDPGAFKAPALPVRLALLARLAGDGGALSRLGRPEVPLQPSQEEPPELGVAPPPEILDLQVDDGPVHLPEAHLDERAVLILALVHDEDAIRPIQIVPRELPRGERRHPGRSDLVSLVVAVEVLRGLAPIHVGRADEQDVLPGRGLLPSSPIVRGPGGTLTPTSAIE